MKMRIIACLISILFIAPFAEAKDYWANTNCNDNACYFQAWVAYKKMIITELQEWSSGIEILEKYAKHKIVRGVQASAVNFVKLMEKRDNFNHLDYPTISERLILEKHFGVGNDEIDGLIKCRIVIKDYRYAIEALAEGDVPFESYNKFREELKDYEGPCKMAIKLNSQSKKRTDR
jgi:hypothetical protein